MKKKRNKINTSKLGVFFILIALLLASLGVSYSAWTDTMYINGTITTGNLDYEIVEYSETWLYKNLIDESMVIFPEEQIGNPDLYLISHAIAEAGDGNPYDVVMSFYNASQHSRLITYFIFEYIGTIPAKFQTIHFRYIYNFDFTPYLNVEINPVYYNDIDQDWFIDYTTNIAESYQIHSNEFVYVGVSLNIDVNDNIMQGKNGTFGGIIELIQWNECNQTIDTTGIDIDGDDIPDNLDNCPNTPNPNQEDIDMDGIGNVCDSCTDVDGDSYCAETSDCNDTDPNVNPGTTEICGNNIDDDCDRQIDEECP